MLKLSAIALLSLLVLAGCATTTTLPPELSERERALRLLDEPPLWPDGAAKGHSRRLRLLLFPPRNAYGAIRIDTWNSGRTVGYLVRATRIANSWVITERRRFPVSPGQLARLDALIVQSRLWRMYPEYWVDPEGVCIDGTQMILERSTPEEYRFSEANAHCTAPRDYLAVVTQVIDMSRDSGFASWLE